MNAITDNEHRTQAITDLIPIHEAFGRLDGIRVPYIGEGTTQRPRLPSCEATEVSDAVLDGLRNRAFRQVRHKLTAMGVLVWCVAHR